MSDKSDDETTPDLDDTFGEDEARPASSTPREPLVSGDPLGLGGTTDPDAASRSPRPKFVSLLIEFFSMSRTTAILLVAFVLIGGLYLIVKQDPVVGIGTPADQPTTSENVPEEPGEQTTDPEVPTDEAPTEDPTATPATSPPVVTPTQGRQAPTATPDQEAPPQQEPQQEAPQQQEPQQQAPEN